MTSSWIQTTTGPLHAACEKGFTGVLFRALAMPVQRPNALVADVVYIAG
jgi:hypothetical protein